MPHCPGGHLQDLIEKKSEKDKSIPLAHVYMTPNTRIHDHSLPWLGTHTSIKKSGGVLLVL
jgi:hypothetical protein